MEAIISHVSTDFDGLASMVAAKKLYPQAKLFFSGAPDKSVRDFLNLYKDFIKVDIPRNVRKLGIRKLILVDCRNPNRLGSFRDLVNDPGIEVHIYDHHPPTQEDIKGDKNYVEKIGATTTILLKRIMEKKIPLTPLEATLMALGVYEETGSLLFKTTTPDDARVVSYLLEHRANLSVVSDHIFHFLNEEQRKLLNELILSSTVMNLKGFKILLARSSSDKYVDGLALVTHRLNDLERMDAVFVTARMGERIYLVGRSSKRAINAGHIARFFGGGGHSTAASAVVKNSGMRDVEKKLTKLLKINVRPVIRARDIMSSPVMTLELQENMTLNEAYEFMKKTGRFSMPIVQEGKLVGLVDRKDMDKANLHGYGNAPLDVYMSKPVVTTESHVSLQQIQNIMMNKGIGCLPVVKEDRLIGIVTRSDVLDAIHEADLSKQRKRNKPKDRLKKLPRYVQDLLHKSGRIGDKLKMAVYVVGGFVRDLFLDVENLDIDLVVEGDGMLFGETLAREMDGRAKIHEKFGTCVVVLPDGMHIDVATSRTEYYTRPAALPEVMESSIKQDLFRRDFTINAMAMRLNRRYYGQVLDFFGCRKDLRNGVIRILHPMSFVDDPTRILRAVKFEQRYQFQMDQSTQNLLKDALGNNIFDNVSAERFRNEFIEILEEARPFPAIKRMEQLKILKLISRNLHLDEKMIETFDSVAATLLQFNELIEEEKVKSWIVYFNVLVMRLKTDEIMEIAKKFRVPNSIIKQQSFDNERVQEIIRVLCARKLKVSENYRVLEGLSLETLIFLIARTQIRIVRSRIVNYINHLRKIKPMIDGNVLMEWGIPTGRVYKKILKILFDAQLDELFTTIDGARVLYETRLKSLIDS